MSVIHTEMSFTAGRSRLWRWSRCFTWWALCRLIDFWVFERWTVWSKYSYWVIALGLLQWSHSREAPHWHRGNEQQFYALLWRPASGKPRQITRSLKHGLKVKHRCYQIPSIGHDPNPLPSPTYASYFSKSRGNVDSPILSGFQWVYFPRGFPIESVCIFCLTYSVYMSTHRNLYFTIPTVLGVVYKLQGSAYFLRCGPLIHLE
jgi:hypothetical protein